MTQTLITRLSRLDAPDREVDAEIWLIELQSAESDPFGGYGLAEDWRYEYEAEEDGSVTQYARNGQVMHKIGRRSSPAYTSSVDAAIALAERVLPGWTWYLGNGVNGSGNNSSVAGIYPPKSPEGTFKGDHPIPATALVIALLRAKEAST